MILRSSFELTMFPKSFLSSRPFFLVIVALASIPLMGFQFTNAQYPMAPSPPQGPPAGYPQQQAPFQQPQPQPQPLAYAFRPNLTNPEYGQCLGMEKRWQSLYQSYYALYNQARGMNPSDPQYAQTANYVNYMKSQLDSAWAEFSGKCVYFPERR
jgi:hypothetical protein